MKYTDETFDELIRKSYGYNSVIVNSLIEWNTVRELYEKNYIQSTDTLERIPKKIHQVWLGNKMPDKYKKFTESWQKFHPDWEYKLWTNTDGIKITRRDIFDRASNFGMKSDILRYEILRQYGGIYADTDFECLKPFDDLLYLEYFTGISYDMRLVLYTGLAGCVPNYPIMNKIVELATFYNGHKASIILDVTGAYHVTRVFNSVVDKNTKGVVAFPMDFFYPFPNNIKSNENIYSYIRPCSYALHHWAVSWVRRKRYGVIQ